MSELLDLMLSQEIDQLYDEDGLCPQHDLNIIRLHPNQVDGIGAGNPEDALLELIDLKSGYLEV